MWRPPVAEAAKPCGRHVDTRLCEPIHRRPRFGVDEVQTGLRQRNLRARIGRGLAVCHAFRIEYKVREIQAFANHRPRIVQYAIEQHDAQLVVGKLGSQTPHRIDGMAGADHEPAEVHPRRFRPAIPVVPMPGQPMPDPGNRAFEGIAQQQYQPPFP